MANSQQRSYRIAVVLTDEIKEEALQAGLEVHHELSVEVNHIITSKPRQQHKPAEQIDYGSPAASTPLNVLIHMHLPPLPACAYNQSLVS